jgi:hypothetical protein
MHLIRVACLGLLSTLAVPSATHAQLTSAPALCSTGNAMTLMNPDAIACSGAWRGSDIGNAVRLAASLTQIQSDFFSFVGSGNWSYLGTTNAGQNSGPFTSVPNSTTGTLDFASPITGFFAVSLRASDQFRFYLFKGHESGISSLAFTTIGTGVTREGVVPGLAHASLYDFDGNAPTTTAPEPASFVLIATGLFAGAMAARRRRRS